MTNFEAAHLVSFVTALVGRTLDFYTIEGLLNCIPDDNHFATVPVAPAPMPFGAKTQVEILMGAMASDRKIEAIKAHRALTGYGIKESKDAVERVMDHR